MTRSPSTCTAGSFCTLLKKCRNAALIHRYICRSSGMTPSSFVQRGVGLTVDRRPVVRQHLRRELEGATVAARPERQGTCGRA